MDPLCRELYVEGSSDAAFISHLSRPVIGNPAMVIPIDHVDIKENISGGNRARLIKFAAFADGDVKNIRCFADADFYHIVTEQLPTNTWVTDGRDAEWYFLREDTFEKLSKLGLGNPSLDISGMLAQIITVCRQLGFLRLTSKLSHLDLPFQKIDLKKSLKYLDESLSVDIPGYLSKLMQRQNISLSKKSEILENYDRHSTDNEALDDRALVSGKDAFDSLEFALKSYGSNRDYRMALRSCFEKPMIDDYPNLSAVINYCES
jgi:hypothetical protein